MKTWATVAAIRDEIADVPHGWLDGFVFAHPEDVRKFAGHNGKLLYRVSAVLAAIDRGEWYAARGGIASTLETRQMAAQLQPKQE